uniref:Reverse transcriptase zinc-binding domain-containing protein n=1 Tax=Tanacetum cinerariifolium TaxID=118510 RepID=A0A699HMV2_TANCI|nr:hypothetical protein [Tanacetum cinerariifolium]GEY13283.1 hypothetical protein [Tanacetum cinerariifolium]
MMLIKWDNVLASTEKGDLGVSSFDALNRALTFKWIWRFRTQGSSLWSRVIKLIHREDGGIEQVQMANLISNLEGFTLPNTHDRWRWFLSGDGEFSVASVRNLINDRTLAEVGAKTRWIKYVPIKVNILAWRIKLNNLPSRLNLSRRGLDLDTIFCPSCNSEVESSNHIFIGCLAVKDLYKFLARWWDVSMTTFFSYDKWWNWFSNLRVPSKLRLIFEGVFGPGHQSKVRLTDDIVAFPFTWYRSRCKAKFSWIDWLKNPSLILL